MQKTKALKTNKLTLYISLLIFCSSCSYLSNDYSTLQSFDEQGNLQVVIENSKGAKTNVIYDLSTHTYTEHGSLKQAHPANKGFVPSTLVSSGDNTKSYPLDVFVVGKTMTKGETVSVKPIAVLKYKIGNSLKYNIVGVPAVGELISDPIKNFEEFWMKNTELRQQISDWVLHNYEQNNIQLLGWYDEDEALSIIRAYQKSTS